MNNYKKIKTFAFFVGYPRSGHSLVGACIDAHPNAVISHELDSLSYIKKGIGREELFDAICEKSRLFSEAGSKWSGYSYHIPNMWQGKFEEIYLIGDKRGGTSTRHLELNPELLEEVKKLAPDYRIIHVIRNPFDCIATAVIRGELKQQREFTSADLIQKAVRFFRKAKTIHAIIEQERSNVINLRHEDLVKNPRKVLTELISFLGLPIFEEYLHACSSMIWPSPNLSREKIKIWDLQTINQIQEQINQIDFLKGYTYHNP